MSIHEHLERTGSRTPLKAPSTAPKFPLEQVAVLTRTARQHNLTPLQPRAQVTTEGICREVIEVYEACAGCSGSVV